ncbi:MAG TPA: hypothetical protein PKA88_20360 [Polyangiaceae bacterium]|nr:hypothetical protein [Polyangiaceae bacterium]HMR76268.1 hypothetical protein [Polyangiaceae bacterium]
MTSAETQLRLVARWDLDKTYLRTEFDTARDLIRTAVERPDRKRSVPGAAALLRELSATGAHIHILSGSPRQMRSRLEEKLLIDRVRWNELTLKPNLSNFARLRFRAMRDQLGYKLPTLLTARARDQRLHPSSDTAELLVGDDAEADAFVYSLFADICAGRVTRSELVRILERGRLYADQAERALTAVDDLVRAPVVRRILIHLDKQSPPSRFDLYGARVVPFYNYFQAALVLGEDGLLPVDGILRIAADLVREHRFDADALARSYAELIRRGHAQGSLVSELCAAQEELRASGRSTAPEELTRLTSGLSDVVGSTAMGTPSAPALDYLALAEKHRAGKNRRSRLH